MADHDLSEELEGFLFEPTWDPLIVFGSTLSLVSCGVMATVMLASDLRKASWTSYVLLWALGNILQHFIHVLEAIVMLFPSSFGKASTAGCEFYHYLQYVLAFLTMTAIPALSLDRLVSSVKSTGWGHRGPRHVVVGLIIGSLVLYAPFLMGKGRAYANQYMMCFPKSPGHFVRYVHWTFITLELLVPLAVSVGAAGFWRLEMRKEEQQRSPYLRLLVTFLLGFVVLFLPTIIEFLFIISDLYFHVRRMFGTLNRVCFFFGPVFLLGCLCTSPMFLKALRSVFLSPSCRRRNDPERLMTEMTQVQDETTVADVEYPHILSEKAPII